MRINRRPWKGDKPLVTLRAQSLLESCVLPTEQIRPMMKIDKIKRPIIVMSDLSCLSGCMLCSIFTGLINSSVVVFIVYSSENHGLCDELRLISQEPHE